jgi:hypothetical protein
MSAMRRCFVIMQEPDCYSATMVKYRYESIKTRRGFGGSLRVSRKALMIAVMRRAVSKQWPISGLSG